MMQPFRIICKKKPGDSIDCQLHLDHFTSDERNAEMSDFAMMQRVCACIKCKAGHVEFTDIGHARWKRGWKSPKGIQPLDTFDDDQNGDMDDIICLFCSPELLTEKQLVRREELRKIIRKEK